MLLKIWFLIWGLLWAVYFMLDGFDLGIGALFPFIAKDENEKRTLINAIGPVWNGNEVWLITAGGVTFAAFPAMYAVMFSAFYLPLMLILFALIIRGVSFEFRSLSESAAGRALWGLCLFAGSAVPALLFGVAFANIFKGIPIDAQGVFKGTLLTFLNPYGLLGGVFFLLMFLHHGLLWLGIKSEGPLQQRAAKTAAAIWPLLLIAALAFLAMTRFSTGLYENFIRRPYLFVIPAAAAAGLVLAKIFASKSDWIKAWLSSCLTIMAATFFGVIGLYPNMLPSSLNPAWSMTVRNSSSSPMTLKIMLGVVLVFVPVVIVYQAWAYNLFKGKADQRHSGY